MKRATSWGEDQPDQWPSEHLLTKKKAIENPPEVTFSKLDAVPPVNQFGQVQCKGILTNTFPFAVGMTIVDVQFTSKQGVILGESSDTISGIPAGGKYEFSVPISSDYVQNVDAARVSRVLVVAP